MNGQVFAVTEPHSQCGPEVAPRHCKRPLPGRSPNSCTLQGVGTAPCPRGASWEPRPCGALSGPSCSPGEVSCWSRRSSGKARHKVVYLRPSEE